MITPSISSLQAGQKRLTQPRTQPSQQSVAFGLSRYKELSSFEAAGDVFLKWAVDNHDGKPGPIRLDKVFRLDLIDALREYVDKTKQPFERLQPSDVEVFKEKINRDSIPEVIRTLRQNRFITYHEYYGGHPSGRGSALFIDITLTPKGKKRANQALETILIGNLGYAERLLRNLQYRLRKGDIAVGDTIPYLLTLEGEAAPNQKSAVPKNVRYNALHALMDLGQVRHEQDPVYQPKGVVGPRSTHVFRVVSATAVPPPAPVNWDLHAMPHLLHHFVAHPQNRQAGAQVPGSAELVKTYGMSETAYHHAKLSLSTDQPDGFLQLSKLNNTYRVAQQPSDHRLLKLLNRQVNQLDHAVTDTLTRFKNAERAKVWPKINIFEHLIAFPTSVRKKASRNRMATDVTNTLTHDTMVPVLGQRMHHGTKHIWLNPSLDYAALKKAVIQAKTDPLAVASGLRMRTPVWRMPRLFNPQVGVVPTIKVADWHGQHRLKLGLTDLKQPGSFTEIRHVRPPAHAPFDPKALPALKLSDRKAEAADVPPLDPQDYARRSLKLLEHIYPLPQLDGLYQRPSVPISDKELANLHELQRPLEAIGYQVELAV